MAAITDGWILIYTPIEIQFLYSFIMSLTKMYIWDRNYMEIK